MKWVWLPVGEVGSIRVAWTEVVGSTVGSIPGSVTWETTALKPSRRKVLIERTAWFQKGIDLYLKFIDLIIKVLFG